MPIEVKITITKTLTLKTNVYRDDEQFESFMNTENLEWLGIDEDKFYDECDEYGGEYTIEVIDDDSTIMVL